MVTLDRIAEYERNIRSVADWAANRRTSLASQSSAPGRGSEVLERLARTHHGRIVIGVTESAVVKASFIAFGGMPVSAADVILTAPTSITEWSCVVQGDIRRVGTWRLERYNDMTDPAAATVH